MNVARLIIHFDPEVKDQARCMRHLPQVIGDFCVERKVDSLKRLTVWFKDDDLAVANSNNTDHIVFARGLGV